MPWEAAAARKGAVDRAAMRPNRDYVGKLALCRKVAGNVCIVRSVIADVGKSFMRIKHKYLFAKLVTNNVKRRNEVRITADEGNCVNIDICLHFFKMLRPRPFRIGAPRRIGRASRVEYNPLTGSVRIVPNSAACRKEGAREKRVHDDNCQRRKG